MESSSSHTIIDARNLTRIGTDGSVPSNAFDTRPGTGLLDPIDNGRQGCGGGIVRHHYFVGANIDHGLVDALSFLDFSLDDCRAVGAGNAKDRQDNLFLSRHNQISMISTNNLNTTRYCGTK